MSTQRETFYKKFRNQRHKVNQLIRKLCANCDDGGCILLDDGEAVTCPQLLTASLCCTYFKAAVLPADRLLFMELYSGREKRRCALCGLPFLPTGNRAVRCPACVVKWKRQRAAERKRRQRERCHALGAGKACRERGPDTITAGYRS
ncbi:MAG: cysteine-rich VLP domain-containing protein [Enterocloster clostridioformis]|nr:cysteine-rich VLP domain-containing protein [Enterocloster clostridioformis]